MYNDNYSLDIFLSEFDKILVSQNKVEKIIKCLSSYFKIKGTVNVIVNKTDTPDEFPYGINVSSQFGKQREFVLYFTLTESSFITFGENNLLCLYNRLFSFIENLGFEINSNNILLISILHEFGHIVYNSTFADNDLSDVLEQSNKMSIGLSNVTIDEDFIEELAEVGIPIEYMLQASEMYADAFAMKHFIPVYKHLQQQGIVR